MEPLSNLQTQDNLMLSFEEVNGYPPLQSRIPDLEELLASFSNLDPRSDTFKHHGEPVAEDWFAEAPCADLYKIDPDCLMPELKTEEIVTDSLYFSPPMLNSLQYNIESHDENFFPEPEEPKKRQSKFSLKRQKKSTKRKPRLVTTILFFALCISMVLSVGIIAFSKKSEEPAFKNYTYTVQSPTMTPDPSDALARMREGSG